METQSQPTIQYRWDSTMKTGDTLVDEQHQELIRQLNLLLAAMNRGQGAAQLDPLLNFLADYAGKHFKHEEQCMAKFHCPAAQANRDAHAEFLRKFTGFRAQLAASKGSEAAVTINILHELSDWLMTHIRRVDTRLLPCVH